MTVKNGTFNKRVKGKVVKNYSESREEKKIENYSRT